MYKITSKELRQKWLDFYKEKGLLYTIDSSINKENTSEQINKVLTKQR